jgi:hypothetical protein
MEHVTKSEEKGNSKKKILHGKYKGKIFRRKQEVM